MCNARPAAGTDRDSPGQLPGCWIHHSRVLRRVRNRERPCGSGWVIVDDFF